MDINRANLDSIFRNVETAWRRGLDNSPDAAFLNTICTTVPSTTAGNVYAWMAKTLGWKLWDPQTGRDYQNVTTEYWQVLNKDFEGSVRMLKKDIEDDNVGVYTPLIEEMAAGYVFFKVQQVMNILLDNAKCFVKASGAYTDFFADTHAYGSNNIDNSNTTALSVAAFDATRLIMAGWKLPNNQTAGVRPTHLLVGPKLEATAEQILKRQWVVDTAGDGAVDNLNYKRCELIVRPEINDTAGAASSVAADDYWYLLDCSRPIKPLVWQERQAANILMDTDPIRVKREGFVDVLGDARGAATPTFPHLAYRQAAA